MSSLRLAPYLEVNQTLEEWQGRWCGLVNRIPLISVGTRNELMGERCYAVGWNIAL